MAEAPRLTTQRLVMRAFADGDRAAFAELNADHRVMEHFPAPLTTEQSDAMVERIAARWETDGHGLWAVDRLDTGQFCGFVGLASPAFATAFTPCVEVGWRLAHQQWGHGFAGEAARAAIDWGFANLALPGDEIVSFTTAFNLRSRRVMEKLGMVHDPTRDFDHPLYPQWDERHHVLYAVNRTTWHPAR